MKRRKAEEQSLPPCRICLYSDLPQIESLSAREEQRAHGGEGFKKWLNHGMKNMASSTQYDTLD